MSMCIVCKSTGQLSHGVNCLRCAGTGEEPTYAELVANENEAKNRGICHYCFMGSVAYGECEVCEAMRVLDASEVCEAMRVLDARVDPGGCCEECNTVLQSDVNGRPYCETCESAELDEVLEPERCDECNGTGIHSTKIDMNGVQEMYPCQHCSKGKEIMDKFDKNKKPKPMKGKKKTSSVRGGLFEFAKSEQKKGNID